MNDCQRRTSSPYDTSECRVKVDLMEGRETAFKYQEIIIFVKERHMSANRNHGILLMKGGRERAELNECLSLRQSPSASSTESGGGPDRSKQKRRGDCPSCLLNREGSVRLSDYMATRQPF